MSTSNKKTIENEKDLQLFIAANPWLLNMNYEAIPKHPGRCLEFQAGEQKRIDLILRDKINKTPVVVEFKFGSFNRENIGQILEYKARVAMTFNDDNAFLYDEFKEFVLTPSLVLVVKSCDDFSRIACNLSGIQVYEYHNFSENFNKPEKIQAIEEFTKALNKGNYPLSGDRPCLIETKIYEKIQKVLSNHDQDIKLQEESYFHPEYAEMFVNRLIFKGEDIQIGLIEDFIDPDDADAGTIQIVYYSVKEDAFLNFGKLYNNKSTQKIEFKWKTYEDCSEGYGRKSFDRVDFFENAAERFEKELVLYRSIVEQMEKRK